MTRDEVIAFIQEVHFGYMATVDADNTPCVRPLGIYNFYGDDVYFFTFSILPKCAEIEANPNVEVVWAKLDTQSQVRLKGKAVAVEDEEVKKRLLTLSDQRITAEGIIVIKAQSHRTQEKNREEAISRLRALILEATRVRRKRIPTRPGRAAREKRLEAKKKRSDIKKLRSKNYRE